MASLRVPITIRPVELVATDDTALDWSGHEKPDAEVIELVHAPQRVGATPDVYICRALTMSEQMQIAGHGRNESGRTFAPILMLSIGLVAVHLGDGRRIETRSEIFDLIEGGAFSEVLIRALAMWIYDASRGDAPGRAFLSSGALS